MKKNEELRQNKRFMFCVRNYPSAQENVYLCIKENSYSNHHAKYKVWVDGYAGANVKSSIGGASYLILKDREIIDEWWDGYDVTTINRMKMRAVISAIKYIAKIDSDACIDVYSDLKYCINVLSGKDKAHVDRDMEYAFWKASKNVGAIVFHWSGNYPDSQYSKAVKQHARDAYYMRHVKNLSKQAMCKALACANAEIADDNVPY